jgi:hypothetical protein
MRVVSDRGRRLPSAGADVAGARPKPGTPQTRSPSYRLAYADQDFLLCDELRPARLQLEEELRAICSHYSLDPALADEGAEGWRHG